MNIFKKHIKPRYLFLLIAILIMLITSISYICINGKTYEIKYIANNNAPSNSATAEVSDKSVARINSSKTVNSDGVSYIIYEVEGLRKGDTVLSIKSSSKKQELTESENHLFVSSTGFVFDGTYDTFSGIEIIPPIAMLFFIIHGVVLWLSLREKAKKGNFGYSMVALGGIFLYFIANTLLFAFITLIFLDNTELLTLMNLAQIILQSALFFIIFSVPFIVLLSLAVSISNIWLVRHEGLRPHNLFGIIMGIIVTALVFLNLYFAAQDLSGSEKEVMFNEAWTAVFAFSVCYLECMLLSTIICAVKSTRYKIPNNIDYIIILGCSLCKDGTPTPLLKGRVDRAIEFEKVQFSKTGKHAKFVPSGGKGSDETISEAESMRNYLIEQGVPEKRIIMENHSKNTYQNFKYSNELILKDSLGATDKNIAFSTTNYHIFRGYILARKLGLKAKGLSAKTKIYFYPNAFIREFTGLLWGEKYRHLIFLLLTAIIITATIFFIHL